MGNKVWTVPTPRPRVDPNGFADPVSDAFWKNVWVASAVYNFSMPFLMISVTTWNQYKEFVVHHERMNKPPKDSSTPEAVARVPSETGDEGVPLEGQEAEHDEHADDSENTKKKEPKITPAKGVEPFERWKRDEMRKLLHELNGHLVLYPTRFLEGEDIVNNFLFNADR
ncbi:hypothetical protein MPER_08284 [Moniliophthora perniciosa FA553]|nr:hypothetical protein MPER_08284 [Moniliophthora perniciosa FA553]